MAKNITIQDCENLYDRFMHYCEHAEQHQFTMLFMLDTMMKKTIRVFKKDGINDNDQKTARCMFRSVLKVMGEDYSMYEEQKEGVTEE